MGPELVVTVLFSMFYKKKIIIRVGAAVAAVELRALRYVVYDNRSKWKWQRVDEVQARRLS